ncbi:MAG TPA: hypothetical protein VL595_31270 [Pseudonocardia sp.]|jgi:hypothetical protein|nr:hypothetical protein [Pseudonocardia sp.]
MALVTRSSHGVAQRRLLEHFAEALDPIAAEHSGKTALELKPILRQAWRDNFDIELREPVLSRCAAAIATRTPWAFALWSTEWP